MDSADITPINAKSQVLDKEKQISRLAKALKQKVQEVIEVEELNKQLKERLKLFQEQNEKNVTIAQEEINKLTSELEGSTARQSLLESEVTKMERELEKLKAQNAELEKLKEELLYEQDFHRQVCEELQEYRSKEEKFELATKYYDQSIIGKSFFLLKKATKLSKALREFSNKIKNNRKNRITKKIFKALQRNDIVEKIIRLKQNEKNSATLQDKFASWKLFVRANKVAKYMSYKRELNIKHKAFKTLFEYKQVRQAKLKNKEYVRKLYESKLLREGINAFKVNYKLYHLDKRITEKLSLQAEELNHLWNLKLSFFKWKKYHQEVARPKALKNKLAWIYYKGRLLMKGMNGIVKNREIQLEAAFKAEKMRQLQDRRLVGIVFSVWKKELKTANLRKKDLENQGRAFLMGKLFGKWREEFSKVRKEKEQEQKAKEHLEHNLKLKYLHRIVNNALMSKQRKMVYATLKKKMDTITLRRALHLWMNTYNKAVAEKEKKQNEQIGLCDKYFGKWVAFIKHKKTKNQKQKRAYRFYAKNMEYFLAGVFTQWKQQIKKKKYLKETLAAYKEKKRLQLCRETLGQMKDAMIRELMAKVSLMKREQESLKVIYLEMRIKMLG
jgi:hypothetical protein